MLTNKEIKEIREHLEKAQNPLFFFDNDADGLCSFLLLRRMIGRGKGVAIKSFPSLDASYARKARELKPDYIFILDKPMVSTEFLNEIHELNLPVVWIDHHDILFPNLEAFENVYYYNTMKSEKPSNEPVTYWAYKIAEKKEDLWIALCGCVGDGFLPEFSNEAEKKYPDYWKPVKSAFSGLYGTQLGKISRILNFCLKDTTSNVVRMIKFLYSADLQKVLDEENEKGVFSRFNYINERLQKFVEKACELASDGKILYFQYGGDLSISADIANELFHKYPEKIIIVAYLKGTKANISIRGKDNVRELTVKAIGGIEHATGGGHKQAVGAQMNVEDLPIFIEKFKKMVK